MKIKILNKPKNLWYTFFSFSAQPTAAGYSLTDEYNYEIVNTNGEMYLKTIIDDVHYQEKIEDIDFTEKVLIVKGKKYSFLER